MASNTLQQKPGVLYEARVVLEQSLFHNIPNEIILRIFRLLSVPDLCNVSLVCRSFNMIANDDEIWKSKCDTSRKLPSKSYKEIYMEWMHEKSLRNKQLLNARRGYTVAFACRRRPPPRSTYPFRPTTHPQFTSIGGFDRHPNTTKEMTIKLSVDIDQTTPQLISLLNKASRFQLEWQKPAVIKQMIQRYNRFLQLKASNPRNTLLIPTLDIEMIWQTHLLRPEMYRNDCHRLFGRMIDHSLVMKNEMEQFFKEQAFLDTCQLYKEKFGENYCSKKEEEEKVASKSSDNRTNIYSYWDKTYFEFSSHPPNDYENPFSFTQADFILDGKWFELCKQFMSNAIDKVLSSSNAFHGVCGIDVGQEALVRLKKSYERFLYMAVKYPIKDGNKFVSPTYAIDIIWHSHMQEPLNYEADCLRLVGYVIYHDPWPIVDDETVKTSCDEDDQIWKDEFKCSIKTDHLYNTPKSNKRK